MRGAALVLFGACGFRGASLPDDGPPAGDVLALDAPIHDGPVDDARIDASLDASADASIDGPLAIPCANPIFDEHFTGTTPCAPWGGTYTNNGTIAQGGGALTIDLIGAIPNGQNASVGCQQQAGFQLTTGGVVVELPNVVGGAEVYTQLQLLKQTQSISFGHIGPTAIRFSDNGGNTVFHAGTYNAVAMRWLRMRRDAAGTGVEASTSPDGLTWTTFFDQVTPMQTMVINLIAGADGGGTTGTSRFTRLVICP